jgi:hypothetical protein
VVQRVLHVGRHGVAGNCLIFFMPNLAFASTFGIIANFEGYWEAADCL